MYFFTRPVVAIWHWDRQDHVQPCFITSSANADVSFLYCSCIDHWSFLFHLLCAVFLETSHLYINVLVTPPIIFVPNVLLSENFINCNAF